MSKRLFIIFILMLCFALPACTYEKKDDGKIKIISTVFPGYDFAKQVIGDNKNITVQQLLPPGIESHGYEPSPKEMIAIEECDLFIYVGGESDTWVEKILKTMQSPPKTVKMMEHVALVNNNHDHGFHEEYDEHVWTSLENAICIIQNICKEICLLDNTNSEEYTNNAANYCNEIEIIKQEFTSVFEKCANKKMVFGDRFPFIYFANEFGLDYLAAFPGCSSETEPDAGTLATIIETVKKEKIRAVFFIEFSNSRVAETIAKETGAQARLFHSCHNVSQKEIDSGVTYLSLMRQNLETIMEVM